MNKWKSILAAASLAAVFAVGVACSSNGEAATTPASQPAAVLAPASSQPSEPAIGAPAQVIEPAPVTVPAPVTSAPVPSTRATGEVSVLPIGAPGFSPAPTLQTGSGQSGIWVSGEGTISVEPDLVLLNVGVESTGKTVSEANAKAATAMDNIVRALRDRGLEDADIQTRSFNIFPQYEFREVIESGIRRGNQVLVGYRVSNSAAIKIRDLDSVGAIIDDVANAGGDSTRINGVNFTVEDPKPLMNDLREAAVMDAMAKAQQFADLTGVGLGRLVFISEGGSGGAIVQDFGATRVFAEAAFAAPSTPIVGGELELKLNVQVVFAIQ